MNHNMASLPRTAEDQENCNYEGTPVRPEFPTGVAILTAAMTLLLSIVLTPVVGVISIIIFCSWRNAKAVCPACGADPFYAPGEKRNLTVGWNAESIALWALATTCHLIAVVSLLII